MMPYLRFQYPIMLLADIEGVQFKHVEKRAKIKMLTIFGRKERMQGSWC